MMTLMRIARLAFLLLSLLVVLSPAVPLQESAEISAPAALDLRAFLPAAADLREWTRKDPPQQFKGEDLFLYIDGGAELYREYGFRQVIAQDYRNKKGKIISLEIFEMASAEAAYGMFTFKSSGKGKPTAVGQDGRLEDYFLNFWKGPCLVTLTGYDAGPECIRGILEIARAVDAKIRLQGNRPSLLNVLPKEWMKASRLVYFRGVLGLNNIYPFFPNDVFRFKEGLAAEQDKFKIFIFRYASPAEARQRFQDVHKAFSQSPAYKDLRSLNESNFEIVDAKGNKLYAQNYNSHISIILTLTQTDRQSVSDMFDQLNWMTGGPESIGQSRDTRPKR